MAQRVHLTNSTLTALTTPESLAHFLTSAIRQILAIRASRQSHGGHTTWLYSPRGGRILPEAVLTQDNEEQTKGLKYNAMIPVLTKAILELKVDE